MPVTNKPPISKTNTSNNVAVSKIGSEPRRTHDTDTTVKNQIHSDLYVQTSSLVHAVRHTRQRLSDLKRSNTVHKDQFVEVSHLAVVLPLEKSSCHMSLREVLTSTSLLCVD